MKKISSILFVFFLLTSTYAQKQDNSPRISNPKSFTWILLPDPQTYQKFERNQPIFDLMIRWIKDQQKNLNIQLVFCVGDMVEQNNITKVDSINGNQTSLQQWRSVSAAFSKLDGILPYILCTGNHEYGIKNAENRISQFNSYFPLQRNPLNSKILVETALNGQGVHSLENACYEWIAPAGQPFLLFSLEFAPRKEILAWAKEVASRPKYQKHIGVMMTHSYLNSNNERILKEKYIIEGANYGETIWNDFIQPSTNIQFVLCGHISTSEYHKGHVGYKNDVNIKNKSVHQIMFNAQREGGGWHGNGGDGWLRILEFLPDQKTLKVSTFSPFFYISPSTRNLAWRQEAFDQFDLIY